MTSPSHKFLIPSLLFVSSTLAVVLVSNQSQAKKVIPVAALDAAPVQSHSMTQIDLAMRTPDVMSYTQLALHQAHDRAHLATIAQSHDTAMERARKLLNIQNYRQANKISSALKKHLDTITSAQTQPESTLHTKKLQITLMLARTEMLNLNFENALTHLSSLQHESTPVQDYIHWLTAESYENLGDYANAYKAYQKVAQISSSPMSHRARVQKAHMLHLAKNHEQAIIELAQVNSLYPDYPRRHVSLFQYAQSLEATGQLDEASLAYQTTWFEFPYKQRGKQAFRRMQELVKRGHTVPAIDAQTRYKRWRRLRINKHWDTARALFRELMKEVEEAEGPHSRMVHEIWQQLALNALIPKRYEEAYYYLQLLKKDYEAGHTDGIDRDLLYEKLADTHAKFGEMKQALRELDKAYASKNSRQRARAEFLEEHGQYKDALNIVNSMSYMPRSGWSYTWLLYKSGQLTQAHKNFMALARRSGGRNQLKYLYWAARTKERLGDSREAKQLYQQILTLQKYDYYSFQATNRMLDMDIRKKKQASNILVGAAPVLDTSDDTIEAFEKATAPANNSDIIDNIHETRSQPRAAHLGEATLERHLEPILCEDHTTQAHTSSICEIAKAAQINLRTTHHNQRAPLRLEADQPTQNLISKSPSLQDQGTLNTLRRPDSKALVPEHLPPQRYRPKLISKDNQYARILPVHNARIFWDGPDTSPLRFIAYDDQNTAIGPHPKDLNAYGDDTSYEGGLERLIKVAGDRFSELERAQWLRQVGMNKEARWAIRDVAMEFRELSRLSSPRREPHQLKAKRMTPLIDNRRVEKSTWGYIESEYRWPVPREKAAKNALLERQRSIIADERKLRPLILDAMKEVGDYYMVRQFTRRSGIRTTKQRMQAYPRAFPELVVPEAKKWGVNPYLIWALMTVESSYNPDSVSTAEALGLLQVIPRTGLKTAELLGEEDFGHYDLLDEDVAIRHGVFYFSQLVRKFHGNELLAMAGYNGGPHRVAEWVDMRGDMPMDEFVEEIPYDQAREYTKKVSRYLHLFLRLYENEYDLYIGNDLDRTWRPMPNF